MRRVIYSMSVSLDGFVETPDRSLAWVTVDEELHTFFNDQARDLGAFLYGRRMYELMVESWPTVDQQPSNPAYMLEFARIWKKMPKIVFSNTLNKVEWNSRLVRNNIAEEVGRLKSQPGGDLGIGGAAIAASFMKLGLIDEFQLFVNPVVLGAGTPYFPALKTPINLKLVETRRFRSGVVYLRYHPDAKAGSAPG